MAKVTKDMVIRDVLSKDPGTGIAEILMKAGLRCISCPSASSETLASAGVGHKVDADALVEEINNYLQTAEA